MSRPIAIFYHSLLFIDQPVRALPNAINIVSEQMGQMAASGLTEAATEIHIGVNGGEESKPQAARLFPRKAQVTFHGLKSRAENLTIVMLENWVKTHPGWNVLYFHSKGATHNLSTGYGRAMMAWRQGMMDDLVANWRTCVADLDAGFDIVCSHWGWNMADGTQHIPMGNFTWITSDFAAKLPSIFLRERIKQDGIAALSSRWEAEVYWGNGPRPNVKSYRPNGGGGVP